MNASTIRYAVVAACLYFAFAGFPGGNLVPDSVSRPAYSGSLSSIHSAASEMESADRQGLSEAVRAASEMLRKDAAGLIKTTDAMQQFIRGTMGFSYTSFASKKYPAVASAIQAELEKAVGPTSQSVDAALRESVAVKLKDISEAVR